MLIIKHPLPGHLCLAGRAVVVGQSLVSYQQQHAETPPPSLFVVRCPETVLLLRVCRQFSTFLVHRQLDQQTNIILHITLGSTACVVGTYQCTTMAGPIYFIIFVLSKFSIFHLYPFDCVVQNLLSILNSSRQFCLCCFQPSPYRPIV